jgi:glycerol kinase
LGAAYAAGLAVQYWQGRADLTANWSVAKRWRPQMPEKRRAQLYGSWQKAITRSLGWTG